MDLPRNSTSEQTETTTDTVFSLDDILPDLLSDEELDPAPVESADSYLSTEEQSANQAAINEESANDEPANDEPANEEPPADCIREDGTIDLDLLKLDIDRRDEEATAPTPPDLAADRMADFPDDQSQPDNSVAATEATAAERP